MKERKKKGRNPGRFEHKSPFRRFFHGQGTDGQIGHTDGRTNIRTNIAFHRDASTHPRTMGKMKEYEGGRKEGKWERGKKGKKEERKEGNKERKEKRKKERKKERKVGSKKERKLMNKAGKKEKKIEINK